MYIADEIWLKIIISGMMNYTVDLSIQIQTWYVESIVINWIPCRQQDLTKLRLCVDQTNLIQGFTWAVNTHPCLA